MKSTGNPTFYQHRRKYLSHVLLNPSVNAGEIFTSELYCTQFRNAPGLTLSYHFIYQYDSVTSQKSLSTACHVLFVNMCVCVDGEAVTITRFCSKLCFFCSYTKLITRFISSKLIRKLMLILPRLCPL